jgi:outer membrane protein assembly factor BamB
MRAPLRAFCLTLLFIAPAFAQDAPPAKYWPRWRGRNDNGSAVAGHYAAVWNANDHIAWKTELPGKGCSTPIVYGEHIVLTCPADDQDAVIDLDWAGRERWRTVVGKDRPGKNRNGSGANPSAVTDGVRLFAYFKSGNLAGLDFAGKLLWSTNLQDRFGPDTLYWDIGTSPVLTERNVVVAVMHATESYLAAFDKVTGELAWRMLRNYKTPVEGDHSYATPIVVQRDGKELIIVWGAEHVTAHDADDGHVVWSCGGFNPQKKNNWVSVASAVIDGDMVIVPYGRGSRLAGVKMGGGGDVTDTNRAWTREDTGSFVPTPAAHDGKVYLLRDRGEVVCLDAKTGETLWSDKFPKAGASYYASPVIADGKLYATREDGVISVAAVAGKFEVLSQNDMGERVIASPVPVADQLLIRGEKHLFCVKAP